MPSRYEVGVDIIDQEHQEIYSLLSKLNQCVQQNDDHSAMWVLKRLRQAVWCHNQTERHMAVCLGLNDDEKGNVGHEDLDNLIRTAIKDKATAHQLYALSFVEYAKSNFKSHVFFIDKPLFENLIAAKESEEAQAQQTTEQPVKAKESVSAKAEVKVRV